MINIKKFGLLFLAAIGAGLISFTVVNNIKGNEKLSATAEQKTCSDICVSLTESAMSPNAIFVKVGEFVQFNTNDGKTHNISLGAGADVHDDASEDHHDADHETTPHEHTGAYSSGEFGVGEAWRVQFKEPGTYMLHDHYNPKLFITVVVYQPGADNSVH